MDLDLELDDDVAPCPDHTASARGRHAVQANEGYGSEPQTVHQAEVVDGSVQEPLPGPAGLLQAANRHGNQNLAFNLGASAQERPLQSRDPVFCTPAYRRAAALCGAAVPIANVPASHSIIESCLVVVEEVCSSAEGDAFVSLKVLRFLAVLVNNRVGTRKLEHAELRRIQAAACGARCLVHASSSIPSFSVVSSSISQTSHSLRCPRRATLALFPQTSPKYSHLRITC